MIDRTTVLTFVGAQFVGLTGYPFFDYKIKKSLMRDLNSSNGFELPSMSPTHRRFSPC